SVLEIEQLSELVIAGKTGVAVDSGALRFLAAYRARHRALPGRPSPIENALRILLARAKGPLARATGPGCGVMPSPNARQQREDLGLDLEASSSRVPPPPILRAAIIRSRPR